MAIISEALIAPNFGGSVFPPLKTLAHNSGHTPTGETPQGPNEEKVATTFSQLLSTLIDKVLKAVIFIFGPVGQLRPAPSYDSEVTPGNNSALYFKLITPSKEEINISITSDMMNRPGQYWDRYATNNKKDNGYIAHCGTILTTNPSKTKEVVEEGFRNIPETFKHDICSHVEIQGSQVRYFLVVPEAKKNSYCLNLPSSHGV